MKHTFTYQVLEGDAREVGRQGARLLKGHNEGMIAFNKTRFAGMPGREREADRLLEMNARWCPGLNEEIEGFAEELGIQPAEAAYYAISIPRTGNCSQFALLPDKTATKTTICARSYEWSYDDALTLQTIRIPGKAAHIGFSVLSFGRFDGLNDRGLWVSMTAGNPSPNLPQNKGFRFWSLIRAILDQCGSIDEAVELASSFPLAFHVSLLVAERGGKAALIEKGPDYQAIRRADEGVLFSTNHFTLPGTRDGQPEIFDHSWKRYAFLRERLASEGYTPETVKETLSASFPRGLAAHFYRETFGTLWSMYADLSEGTLQACFGPPDLAGNPWRTFSPLDPAGVTRYEAELPDEKAPDGTWARIPRPGEN